MAAADRSSGAAGALSKLWSNGKDDGFSLSNKERIMGFFLCLAFGTICFVMAFLLTPVLIVKSRKFAVLFTLGSLFSLGSFSFLWGPWEHIKHLLSLSRLPFTAAYIISIIATLYFALVMHSTILTIPCAITQVLALIWFLISYIPGGTTGFIFMAKLFSSLCTRTVTTTLDV